MAFGEPLIKGTELARGIVLGVIARIAVLAGFFYWAMTAYEKSSAAAAGRARAEQVTKTAADKRQREKRVRKAKHQRIEALGAKVRGLRSNAPSCTPS